MNQFLVFFYSYGLVYSVYSSERLAMANVPRNVAGANAQSFSTYYRRVWNGHRCLESLGIGCTNNQATRLATGEYKLGFYALKHFGNTSDPNGYDVYYTPSFNLVY